MCHIIGPRRNAISMRTFKTPVCGTHLRVNHQQKSPDTRREAQKHREVVTTWLFRFPKPRGNLTLDPETQGVSFLPRQLQSFLQYLSRDAHPQQITTCCDHQELFCTWAPAGSVKLVQQVQGTCHQATNPIQGIGAICPVCICSAVAGYLGVQYT